MNLNAKQMAEFARDLQTRTEVSDTKRLKLMHVVCNSSYEHTHQLVQDRLAVNRKVAECAENGVVCIVEGGMDCDCSAYEGHVWTASADLKLFWIAIDEMYYQAEGPIHWYIIRPSEVHNVHRSSRDLALEAFENGHAHCVIY